MELCLLYDMKQFKIKIDYDSFSDMNSYISDDTVSIASSISLLSKIKPRFEIKKVKFNQINDSRSDIKSDIVSSHISK